jgi:hypothetical protein
MGSVQVCVAGVGVREDASEHTNQAEIRSRNLKLGNVATWSSCVSGAEKEYLRQADETLASECVVAGDK